MFFVLCLSSSTAQRTQRIHVNGANMFTDDAGRVRIFHGFNDVGASKGRGETPGGPQYLAKHVNRSENVKLLEDFGFNAIRLPMMWSGGMPGPDTFDQQYFANSLKTVRLLGSHGIYSLLDMHQDVLSSKFAGYDGAPRWLVNKSKANHEYPWPVKKLKTWSEGYVTEAVGQAFQDIYDNTHGGLEAWAAFWKEAAVNFAGETAVLGYELMNEPWAGGIYQEPTRILPGEAGSKNLLPSYDFINNKIREVDDETLIFYEPVTWGMVLPGQSNTSNVSKVKIAGSGFSHVPGGEAYRNRSVFSFHYYCWFAPIDGPGGDQPLPPLTKAACDAGLAPLVFEQVHLDVAGDGNGDGTRKGGGGGRKGIGGGSMLTEFGAQTPDLTKPDADETVQLLAILQQADRSLQSWTYWDIGSLMNQTGIGFKMNNIGAFIRTYAPAIAGTPLLMQFDPKTKIFQLEYRPETNPQNLPTEVFVPELLYPNGFTVSASDNLSWEMGCDATRPRVLCVKSETEKDDGIASLKLEPKPKQTGSTAVGSAPQAQG